MSSALNIHSNVVKLIRFLLFDKTAQRKPTIFHVGAGKKGGRTLLKNGEISKHSPM